MDIVWQSIGNIEARQYQCGFCGNIVATSTGYYPKVNLPGGVPRIYICPFCSKPTFFEGAVATPGVIPGGTVTNVPKDLNDLYDEARRSISVSAFTASVLCCRKLLMNIAVSLGAATGDRFIQYVEYLADNHYVPPNGRGWVDHIRKKGNEATHEIALMSIDDAMELVMFAEMLLKFIYEFPARVPAGTPVK